MNKYSVKVTRKDGEEFGHKEIETLSKAVCYNGVYIFENAMVYESDKEEAAMRVYAKAKRNLDLRRYMVSLELPKDGERKPRHLGSC